MTVGVPPVKPETERLLECTQHALANAIDVARAGNRLNAIGRAVQNEAERCGYNVIRDLSGHGVGRHIHEKPSVPNYFTHRAKDRLSDGLVITLEPFLTPGRGASTPPTMAGRSRRGTASPSRSSSTPSSSPTTSRSSSQRSSSSSDTKSKRGARSPHAALFLM